MALRAHSPPILPAVRRAAPFWRGFPYVLQDRVGIRRAGRSPFDDRVGPQAIAEDCLDSLQARDRVPVILYLKVDSIASQGESQCR